MKPLIPNQGNIKSERIKRYFAEIAKKIILEEGIEQVSIRKIAKLAGYSYATIYNHFNAMDELLWYTRSIMIEDLGAHILLLNNEKIHTVQGLKNLFRSYMDYFITNPNIFRFFYFHCLDITQKKVKSLAEAPEFNERIDSTFKFLIESGKFSAEEVGIIIKNLIFSIQGTLTLLTSGNDVMTIETAYKNLDELIDYLIKEV